MKTLKSISAVIILTFATSFANASDYYDYDIENFQNSFSEWNEDTGVIDIDEDGEYFVEQDIAENEMHSFVNRPPIHRGNIPEVKWWTCTKGIAAAAGATGAGVATIAALPSAGGAVAAGSGAVLLTGLAYDQIRECLGRN